MTDECENRKSRNLMTEILTESDIIHYKPHQIEMILGILKEVINSENPPEIAIKNYEKLLKYYK